MTILKKKFGTDRYEALYLVNENSHGMRLDQFLQQFMTSFSREHIKEKIKSGEVKILGRPGKHRPNTKVHEGEKVEMFIPKTEHEDEYWNGQKLELEPHPEVLHEDDDLLVIGKPPYMSTHPAGRHLFYCATVYFEDKYDKTVHSIHRLDRETSGVLLLGKNPKAAQLYTDHFENERVRKCYFFIGVLNKNFKGEKRLEANERLAQTTKQGNDRVLIQHFPEDSNQGKHAQTRFRILHQEKGYCLGLAFPQTGRQHQIRVHAMIHGFPLLGDKIYYGSYPMFQRFKENQATPEDHEHLEISRHALHALALNLPYRNEYRTFRAHIPKDLREWINQKLDLDLNEFEKILDENIEDYFRTSRK